MSAAVLLNCLSASRPLIVVEQYISRESCRGVISPGNVDFGFRDGDNGECEVEVTL